MGAFTKILFIVIGLNLALSLFGIISPESNIISAIINGTFNLTYFINNLISIDGIITNASGLLITIAGVITKRDEVIYGGILTTLFGVTGLFNIFNGLFPTGNPVGNILSGLLSFIFAWTAIEWLRGKD
jgi:hypothetical protein